ncbi:MAG: ABC transporter permease [Nocardiopsaceae bacterium]|nr:ABC transporter permease [Nocardiopsaceae bacterium]
MTRYLAWRTAQAVVTVIGVMILTFILVHLVPGSAARAALGMRATSTRIAIFNTTYGLDKPLYIQFFDYVGQLFHGNFGVSYTTQQPVSAEIAQRLPGDILLVGVSTVLAVAIAIPMGIYQAIRRHRPSDHLLDGVSFTLYSMPDFFVAFVLIALLSVQLHVFPPEAPDTTSVTGMLADPRALVLPIATLTLSNLAGYSRYMRAAAIDVLAEDYLRVVRAKGLPERLVLSRHVLRNSVLPMVTLVGLSLPTIVAGAVIAETVFNFQGMGLLFFRAATSKDFPVLLGTTLIIGGATVVGNLIADVAYGVLDPRIRYGSA